VPLKLILERSTNVIEKKYYNWRRTKMGWLTRDCLIARPGQQTASAQAEQRSWSTKRNLVRDVQRDPDMSWLQRHVVTPRPC
jgi:hypothetical protein